MSHKIYRVTEDGDFSYLRDQIWSNEVAVEIVINDATLAELINACDLEFESANYHQFVGATELWTDAIKAAVGEDVAKRVLWDVVTKHSFLWADNL